MEYVSMNERIKKLEKQCWDHQTNHLNSEKFAELIVKECMDALRQAWYDENAKTVDDDPRSVAIQVGMKSGLVKASNVVAKHFGVKQ